MKFTRHLFLILILSVGFFHLNAQNFSKNSYGKGHKVYAEDSSFHLNFEGRFQSLYVGKYDHGSGDYNDQFLIRRARLKFKGFVYNLKLSYKFELGLSNRDISSGGIPQSKNTANIVLDAVIKYNFYGNWSLWAGQTKLPGNIERVISSAALQFVDRSNLNSQYNIDRDAGIQLRYKNDFFRLKTAISTGEGRNITVKNAGGYDYTARVEWLPFGQFSSKGDYFGSDLKREQDVQLMIGFTYDYNVGASRTKGQRGSFLDQNRDLESIFADAHLKYQGFSSMIEFANRVVHGAPIINAETGNEVQPFYVGDGVNAQIGYLFSNNIELAARYTEINPAEETQRSQNQQYTIGVSKYFVGHKLKMQSDVSYITEEQATNDQIQFRLQFELTL